MTPSPSPRRTQRSPEALAYRRLYKSAAWRSKRANQLGQEPWCVRCLADGKRVRASVADHVIPHRGDVDLFWNGDLQSLCWSHHSSDKQSEESWGSRAIGVDGWPLDKRHRANTGRMGLGSAPHPPALRRSLVAVHLVCGPPASGKTSFVQQHKGPRDLVLDLDWIIADMSRSVQHDWNGRRWLGPALSHRNRLLDMLAEPNRWPCAWLIVGEPKAQWRQWWRDKLGRGTTYMMATPPDECFKRIAADPSRRNVVVEHRNAVLRWWNNYKPAPGDVVVGEHSETSRVAGALMGAEQQVGLWV